jgi:hypothetical protein
MAVTMNCTVWLILTDVSEDNNASVFRVEKVLKSILRNATKYLPGCTVPQGRKGQLSGGRAMDAHRPQMERNRFSINRWIC